MDEEISNLLAASSLGEVDDYDDDDEKTLSDPTEVRSDLEDDSEDDLEPEGAYGGPPPAAGGPSFKSLYQDAGADPVPSARAQDLTKPGLRADILAARRAENRRASLADVKKKRSRRSHRRHSNDKDRIHNVICNQAEVQGFFVGSQVTGTCKNCENMVMVKGHYVEHMDGSDYKEHGPERMSPFYREPTPSPTHRKALRDYKDGKGPTEHPPMSAEEAAAMWEACPFSPPTSMQGAGSLETASYTDAVPAGSGAVASGSYAISAGSYAVQAGSYSVASAERAVETPPFVWQPMPAAGIGVRHSQLDMSGDRRFTDPQGLAAGPEDPRRDARGTRKSGEKKSKKRKHKRKD